MDIIHFVTFTIVEEGKRTTQTRQMDSIDIQTLSLPKGTVTFKTFDITTDDIFKNGKLIARRNDRLNELTYFVGTLLSLDDIKKKYGIDSKEVNHLSKIGAYGAVLSAEGTLEPLTLQKRINIFSPEGNLSDNLEENSL